MSHEVMRALQYWPATARGADVAYVESPSGYSGATVWRVEAAGGSFALRRWQPRMDATRLERIHAFQSRVAELGPPVVPVLQPTKNGSTMAASDERLWELATWRPGIADFWQNPNPQRLDAAMRTLAAIHNAAEFQPALPWPKLLELFDRQSDPLDAQLGSRSARRRAARLAYIVEGAWRTRDARVISEAAGIEQPLACEAISLIQSLAPRELDKALHWQSASLPLQRRLGDVHHDHVLFTGDEVTGVVDFGAADYDSPAGDVGRLLGSLVNEDRDGWRRGLDAYCAVHPLTPDELSAADFFDTSGTVISVANWLQWLWGEPDKRLKLSDYTRPLARLNRLVDRLRSLVARGD